MIASPTIHPLLDSKTPSCAGGLAMGAATDSTSEWLGSIAEN